VLRPVYEMSMRFPDNGVANGSPSTPRIGTLTTRMIRVRRRLAASFIAMIGVPSLAVSIPWLVSRCVSDHDRAARDVDDHPGQPGSVGGGEERGGGGDVV